MNPINPNYERTIALVGLICTALLVPSLCQEISAPPVESLPAPTGPFPIGRRQFDWFDPARKHDAMHGRPVFVMIYYPSTTHAANSAEYFPGATKIPISEKTEFLRKSLEPAWKLITANKFRSHATENAPISKRERKLPVLLFSPAVGVASAEYSVQLEDIASHGYVVVAIDHPYDAPLLVLSNGTLIPFDQKTWNRYQPPGPPTLDGVRFENERQSDWVLDSQFVLKELQSRSQTSFFNRLDLSQIGAFGHSMGGAVAMKMCQTDRSVRACLNEDGDISGRTATPNQRAPSLDPAVPVNRPLLVFSLMEPGMKAIPAYVNLLQERRRDLKALLNGQKTSGYLIGIDRTDMNHGSFSDISLLDEHSTATGSLQLIRFTSKVACAFFDQFVKGSTSSDLNPLLSDTTIGTVSPFPQ